MGMTPVTRAFSVLLCALLLSTLSTASAAVGGSAPVAAATDSAAPADGGPASIATPARTDQIQLVSSTVTGGWRYDYYRNSAYVCAVSGHHTFTIATKVGRPDSQVRPLWVFMHGGGVGWFRPDGTVESMGQKTEESAATQREGLRRAGLLDRIENASVGFRLMAVSMCSHDIYAGTGLDDPYNPNRKPDGSPRTVDGLWATKSAIAYALQERPTDDYFLHGGSAGSFGSFGMAWALQQQGIAPTGVVADSGVLFRAWQELNEHDPVCGRDPGGNQVLQQRLHPEILDPANEPAALVVDGRLTVPLMQVWSIGDPGQCGEQPTVCPTPGSPTMGSVDCLHEPLRAAIEDEPSGRSSNLRLCVDNPNRPGSCDRHVPTMATLTNTLAGTPADYLTTVMDWVTARLADDGNVAPASRSDTASFATAARVDFLGSAPDLRRVEADVMALDAGRARRAYLTALSSSDEWLAALVGQLYEDTLGRPGEPSGVEYWIDQVRRGRSVAQVAAQMYASEEYYEGLGGGTDARWISDLYRKVLDRDADSEGLAYWARQVSIAGRSSVALRLYQSPESARARVIGLHRQLLGRNPEPAGVDYWSARIVRSGDLALAVELAVSQEYWARAVARFP